jgi:hypothetical protein
VNDRATCSWSWRCSNQDDDRPIATSADSSFSRHGERALRLQADRVEATGSLTTSDERLEIGVDRERAATAAVREVEHDRRAAARVEANCCFMYGATVVRHRPLQRSRACSTLVLEEVRPDGTTIR